MGKKAALIVLDGWGHGEKNNSNAIFCANTPFTDSLYSKYANAELRTDGENVGLPDGQMGNSEVGHMNLGAGRIVYQDLVKINVDIRSGVFEENPILLEAISACKKGNGRLHLMGLVSDGGVHSHLNHLVALVNLASNKGINDILIHAFTDGRDTDPKSGLGFIHQVEEEISGKHARIVSLIGRYYAMDRDLRWERIQKAYDMLVSGIGKHFPTAAAAIEHAYHNNITDEFIDASIIGEVAETIADNDVVICFNFRTDRCRQITRALTQEAFHEQNMHPLSLAYYTMTNYDSTFRGVKAVYEKDNLKLTLGEVVSNHGLKQVRIAETEKYPHVTFFFSGGREEVFPGERRLMIHSPKVATYDLQPEMSAQGVADAICKDMEENEPDFFCLNFANPDMVGHTGVFEAIVKAVETTDRCLQQVVECGLRKGYSFVVLADHGNADKAINEDGSPNTAHTTNPVPVWILNPEVKSIQNGVLADVAPTILDLLGLPQPGEMTGKSLIR